MPRQRNTINSVMHELRVNRYTPENIVFSDSSVGRVSVLLDHITTNTPAVYFVATKAGTDKPARFDTLGLALAYIGLPEA